MEVPGNESGIGRTQLDVESCGGLVVASRV